MTEQHHNLLTYSTLELESRISEIANSLSGFETIAPTFSQFAQMSVELLVKKLNLYFAALFWVDSINEFLECKAGSGEYGKKILERDHRLKINPNRKTVMSTSFNQNAICLDSFDSNLLFEGFFFSQLSNQVDDKNVGPAQFVEGIQYESPLLPETGLRLFFPLRTSDRVAGILELHTLLSDPKNNNANISLSEWIYNTAKPLLLIADQIAGICTTFEKSGRF